MTVPGVQTEVALRVGEVVEATTIDFVAECYDLHRAPAFGSFVRANEGEITIYAVTAGVTTGGIDAGRRPMARGRDEASEEDVYHNNPELTELLRTEFRAIVVGFRADGRIRHYLPPRPPHIHGFIYECTPAEVREFSARFHFLATLTGAGQRGSTDELIAACLRQAGSSRGDERAYLVRAGKELAQLLSGEVSRLNNVLRRIRP